MLVKPIKTKVFKEGQNLFDFIVQHIKKTPEGAVIVIASKIVGLAENRTAKAKNEKEKEKIIKQESSFALKTKHVWLTIKDGQVMASSGMDESNAKGKLVLLPKDSFKTARQLLQKLKKEYGVKKLGVLIVDSRTLPLRAGVTGVALGYAGFQGIRDYRGEKDIFGRKFKFARTNVADSLATAAVLVMGEGNEQQPLAVVEQAPVKFSNRINPKELHIDIKNDMYGPLFAKLPNIDY